MHACIHARNKINTVFGQNADFYNVKTVGIKECFSNRVTQKVLGGSERNGGINT
jgi:hypothetical protein